MKKITYICILSIAMILVACDADNAATDGNFASEDGQSGSLARFTILNDYLYTVDYQNLNVFNISNNENPVLVNSINIGFNIETLFAYKTYLYIGSRNGMFIYDAATLETPQLLSSVQHFTACDPVIANETHAFVTLKGGNQCGVNLNVLEVYDVTDVSNPVLISQRNLAGPVGMGFYGDYLFVCDDEVKIFDISDPEDMNLVHAIDTESFDVIIQDDLLILIGAQGVYQYALDSNDIQNETLLSTLSL
ncbi:hypothetical protein H2O64_14690 [Kordia sp. YSTF-M3]|uniref:LVIVD repeat-containing protein n=1 Tax=Kordia aestuariivivens TaxID=2759037 RepID=A0ABR7QBQ1_9FLAO|nr:hypothetical protein [Kordia aestuariivivens]MBC8755923.1 hypothetical protein [Kordia aestuariivivens]